MRPADAATAVNTSGRNTAGRALLCLVAIVASGCGGGEEPRSSSLPQPSARTDSAPAESGAPATTAAPASPAGTGVATIITEIDRHTFPPSARDPFSPPVVQASTDGAGNRSETGIETPICDVNIEPLGMIPPESLRLLGLVTGTPVPRAMFVVLGSADSQALIVSEGAKIGPMCSAQIVDIRDNEVVIEQRSMIPDERVTTVIALSDQTIEDDAYIEDENATSNDEADSRNRRRP